LVPVNNDLGSMVGGRFVEVLSWCQVAEDRDLVRSVVDPAKLIETAQHAV
jgi:hypothetical protein